MKKKKVFLAFLAVLFGVFIFTSSLVTYSQQGTTSPENVSSKKFYIDGKVLPDHVLYPSLMVVDKGLQLITSGDSKVYLQIRLAQDRMLSAKKLLDKDQEVLALSTLTKSQKYLILASEELFSKEDYSKETAKDLLLAFEENTQNLSEIEKNFENIPTNPIGDLVSESNMLIEIIKLKIRN